MTSKITHPLSDIQLLLLPGLGGDSRMMHHQKTLECNLISFDYPEWPRGETLPRYADRLKSYILSNTLIDFSKPFILGGISLGGALAIELATLFPQALGVVLLGSLTTADELRPLIRVFGKWIAPLLPRRVYRGAASIFPLIMSSFSKISDEDVRLSLQMYRDLPEGLFQAGYTALSSWQRRAPIELPVLRIHGELDQIIPLSRTSGVDLVVKGAKHLVAWSEPAIVNERITSFMSQLVCM